MRARMIAYSLSSRRGCSGSKVFPSFVKFLKSSDPSDDTEANLLAELEALEASLATHGVR